MSYLQEKKKNPQQTSQPKHHERVRISLLSKEIAQSKYTITGVFISSKHCIIIILPMLENNERG